MAQVITARYGDCELHGAAVKLIRTDFTVYECEECHKSYRRSTVTNLRAVEVPAKGPKAGKKCDGRCVNGKHACDCHCGGRCHGAGECYC